MIALARLLLICLAVAGYAANGAQAHVSISQGETVSIMMCGMGDARMVEVQLGEGHTEATPDTCCGDCTVPAALPAPAHLLPVPNVQPTPALIAFHAPNVHPRSPLWPGAPPHGPPAARTV